MLGSILSIVLSGKLLAGVATGLVAARTWFAKEIATGKAILAYAKARTSADFAKAELALKKLGFGLESEVQKVEAEIKTDIKKV